LSNRLKKFNHVAILSHRPTPPSLGAMTVVPLSAVTDVLFQRYKPTGVASVPTAANWLIEEAATARRAVRSATLNHPTVPVKETVSLPTQGSQQSDVDGRLAAMPTLVAL